MSDFEKQYLKDIISKLIIMKKDSTCNYLFDEVIDKLMEIIKYDD